MRTLIDKSIGYVPTPQPITPIDGKLTAESARYLSGMLLVLAQAVNGGLRVGDGTPGSKSGNVFGQWITVLTPSVADTEFIVDHALGYIPVAVLPSLADKACSVYVSRQGSWTPDRIYLKCSAASVTLRLWLL